MIKNLQYLFATASLVALTVCFTACKDDDETIDEWSPVYAYIERPVLGKNGLAISLTHSSLGIKSTLEKQPLIIRLNRTYASDVTIVLGCESEGDLPAGALAFRSGTVVIPAGKTIARDTLDVVTDWGFVPKDAVTYTAAAQIKSIRPTTGIIKPSPKQQSLGITVSKAGFADVLANVRPSGKRIADRSGWTATYQAVESEDKWYTGSAILDGDSGSYIFPGGTYVGIKVDLGATKSLTGVETYSSYGGNYTIASCSILTSVNGTDWTSITGDGVLPLALKQQNQYVKFIAPVSARYIKWNMYGNTLGSSYPLCSEFYAYSE